MISLLEPDEAKASARRLRRALAARGVEVGHSASLELVAARYGARDWNTYLGVAAAPGSRVDQAEPPPGGLVPVVRIFDWEIARAWYVDYLGWSVVWMRRDGDHLPVYARLAGSSGAVVELSEHHGDGTPGGVLVITVDDLARCTTDCRNDGRATPNPRSSSTE